MLVQQWAWSTYYRMDISFEHTEPYTTSGHRSKKVIITCFSLVQSSWMLTHIHQTKNVSPVISLQSVTTESQTSVPRPTSCCWPWDTAFRDSGTQLFNVSSCHDLPQPPAALRWTLFCLAHQVPCLTKADVWTALFLNYCMTKYKQFVLFMNWHLTKI